MPTSAAASYVRGVMQSHSEIDAADPGGPPPAAVATRSRAVPVTLLVAALVGFLLPFATVSCDTPVTFTGLELATATVPADDDAEFADEIESHGTVVAAIALVTIALGLGLLATSCRGWGVASVVGMLALLLLPWIATGALAEFELHEGYVLSVGSLAVVAGLRRVESFGLRRGLGRRAWPAVVAGVLLAVPIVLTLVLAAYSDVYGV